MTEPRGGRRRVLAEDPWLSTRLGVPSFRVRTDASGALPDAHELERELAGVPAGAFADARTAVSSVRDHTRLFDLDFRLVDTLITLSRPACALSAPGFECRPAVDADRAAVEDLACGSFRFDRFHADPLVDDGRADRIKRDWAGGYFDGHRGDAMVVWGPPGRPSAFLLAVLRDERLVIDLIAVAGEVRGRGIAAAMVSFALSTLECPAGALVGTQLANTPSLRAYERMGFRFQEAAHVWHRGVVDG